MPKENRIKIILLVSMLVMLLSSIAAYAEEAPKTERTGLGTYPDAKPEKIQLQAFEEYTETVPVTDMKHISGRYYLYDLLSADEKDVYRAFFTITEHPTEKVKVTVSLNGMTSYGDVIDKWICAFHAFKADHPERAWFITRYDTYYNSIKSVSIILVRPFKTMAEYHGYMNTVLNRVNKCINTIPKTDLPQVKAYKAYSIIGKMVNYGYSDCGEKDPKFDSVSHTMFTLYNSNLIVCDGYASLYKYVLNRLGIECLAIPGEVMGGGHEWNLVKLGGKWYEADICWDDDDNYKWNLSGAISYNKNIKVDYYYLNRTTANYANMSHDRKFSSNRYVTNMIKKLPTASSTFFNGDYMYAGVEVSTGPGIAANSWSWSPDEFEDQLPVVNLYQRKSDGKCIKLCKGVRSNNNKINVYVLSNKKTSSFVKHISKVTVTNMKGTPIASAPAFKAAPGWIKATVYMDNGQIIRCSDKLLNKKSSVNCYKVKSISLEKTKFKYNGKSHKTKVKAKGIDGKVIPASKYKVTYEANKTKGKHKVYIKFNDGKTYVKSIRVA